MKYIKDFDVFGEKDIILEKKEKEARMPGDVVLINYWENDEIIPVKILKAFGRNKYSISYDVNDSVLSGSPDGIIDRNDIISSVKSVGDPAEPSMVNRNGQEPISNDIVTGVF